MLRKPLWTVTVYLGTSWMAMIWPVKAPDAIPSQLSLFTAARQDERTSAPIRPHVDCPENLETLTTMLLRDLPGYANRVSQRSRVRDRSLNVAGYVLLAGRPEFEPLSLGPGEYRSIESPDDDAQQVFFTTLERQYVSGASVEFQHFHWLFLTKAPSGWRFVTMLSRIGSPPDEPPSPPQDTSFGVVGQAVRLWLRDCRTGNINPL